MAKSLKKASENFIKSQMAGYKSERHTSAALKALIKAAGKFIHIISTTVH